MVDGVNNKFEETLTLNGVGYKAAFSNNKLTLNLGFSHPIIYDVPENVEIKLTNPTEIVLLSHDKQLLGEACANIIKYRPAKKDPYKHKGIKKKGDILLKKAGKKVG